MKIIVSTLAIIFFTITISTMASGESQIASISHVEALQSSQIAQPTSTPIPIADTSQPAETNSDEQKEPIDMSVEELINYWAGYYGVDAGWLLRVAQCESRLNPSSVNYDYYAGGGNPTGVFQFLPETFNRYSNRAGVDGDIWNANDNVRVAAYAFSVGGAGEWACK